MRLKGVIVIYSVLDLMKKFEIWNQFTMQKCMWVMNVSAPMQQITVVESNYIFYEE